MLKNLNLHFVVEVSSVVVLRNKSCNSFYRHTLIFWSHCWNLLMGRTQQTCIQTIQDGKVVVLLNGWGSQQVNYSQAKGYMYSKAMAWLSKFHACALNVHKSSVTDMLSLHDCVILVKWQSRQLKRETNTKQKFQELNCYIAFLEIKWLLH